MNSDKCKKKHEGSPPKVNMTDVIKNRLSALAAHENSRVKQLVDRHLTLKEENVKPPQRLDIDEVHSAVESLTQKLQETVKKRNRNIKTTCQSTHTPNSIAAKKKNKENAPSGNKRIYTHSKQRKKPSKTNRNYETRHDDSKRRQVDSQKVTNGKVLGYKPQGSLDKKEEVKRRHTRMEQTQKRRLKLETERVEKLHRISGIARKKRIKKRSTEEKKKIDKLKHWLICVQIGAKLQLVKSTIMNFRAHQRHLQIEDLSARVITRQMRVYKFKCYRKRVRGAVFVLGSIFVMKIKIWKLSRRRDSSDKVRAFLVAIDDENRRTNGCLAKVIVKGKKWRAYRQKIVILQRLWRDKMKCLSGQVLLIDLQWQREQSRRTEEHIDSLYTSSMRNTTAENEKLDTINRTRKLIKLRPLPRIQYDTRDVISHEVSRGEDLLTVNHIVSIEIRRGIIRDMLRHLRLEHLARQQRFLKTVEDYQEEQLRIQRQRSLLINFSGCQIANTWVKVQHNERQLAKSVAGKEPQKPRFRIILQKSALGVLIATGEKYVSEIRNSWKPNSMIIPDLKFDGRKAAEAHLRHDSPRTSTSTIE